MVNWQETMTRTEESHIIFVEDWQQAQWVKDSSYPVNKSKVIALSAEAQEALEEFGITCTAIGDIADTYPLPRVEEKYIQDLIRILREIEDYWIKNNNSGPDTGPGILTGNYYVLQYTISGIAKRILLIKTAIGHYAPQKITVFNGQLDDWFSGYGYRKNPWVDVVDIISGNNNNNIVVEHVQLPLKSRSYSGRQITDTIHSLWKRGRNRFFKQLNGTMPPGTLSSDYDGMRLLFVESAGYDWEPVVNLLKTRRNVELFRIDTPLVLEKFHWSRCFSPNLKDLVSGSIKKIDVPATEASQDPGIDLIREFDSWLATRREAPEISVFGVNVFPLLIPQIRSIIEQGEKIASSTDAFSKALLNDIKPHALCFFNITYLSEKRLAYQCNKAGIPVVCYQHGFGYNIGIQPKDEGNDQATADYFLSYGSGSKPRSNSMFPVKARFVPVGSARIESMIRQKKCGCVPAPRIVKITWIAETTTSNTLVSTLTEDTKRYRIQKKCLKSLSACNKCHVVYRPLKKQVDHDGTSSWIRRENISGVTIDSITPLEELICNSTIIISDISSPTTWAEVLGFNKPLVLYCDPVQTPIAESVIPDLENACIWCKTEQELYETIRLITEKNETFHEIIQTKDIDPFISKYILHKHSSALQVCRFLLSLRDTS